MNRALVILSFCALLSCSSQKINNNNSKYAPEISSEILQEQQIVPINDHYKSNYYKLLPYLYYNGRSDFKRIKGDYYSMSHHIHKEVNIMAGFWDDYGGHKNVLVASVWVEGFNEEALDTLQIQVHSSKHGFLKITPKKRNPNRHTFFKELCFTKVIELEERADILNKINDDVIIVSVNGYKYELLTPEIRLDKK